MNILAIETSGRDASLAVRRGGALVGESVPAAAGRRHAQTLVAELDRLLRASGLKPADLDGAAVSIGPGSFTGLRVGVACAKALAWATGCRIAAVDTLLAIAVNSPDDVASVYVISDAQRGDLFAARYLRAADGSFLREGDIEIVDVEQWCAERRAGDVVSGPGLEKYAAQMPGGVRLLEAPLWQPLARVVALLGERQLAAGDVADMWTLEPFYLRKSAAEEKASAGAAADKV